MCAQVINLRLVTEKKGENMATIKEIAERLGVSISTVSKGLNGASDISEEMRQTVLDLSLIHI